MRCLPPTKIRTEISYVVFATPIFPTSHTASATGLVGYDRRLSVERMQDAYAHGIFPWPHREQDGWEIGWYSPDPRAILPLDGCMCPDVSRENYGREGFGLHGIAVFRRSCASVRRPVPAVGKGLGCIRRFGKFWRRCSSVSKLSAWKFTTIRFRGCFVGAFTESRQGPLFPLNRCFTMCRTRPKRRWCFWWECCRSSGIDSWIFKWHRPICVKWVLLRCRGPTILNNLPLPFRRRQRIGPPAIVHTPIKKSLAPSHLR